MIKIILTYFFAFFTLYSFAQCEILLWEDNFDGTELNSDYWSPQYGDGSNYGIWGWGNNELEYYTDEEDNLKVEGGKLIITAQEEAIQGSQYTSARIRTIDKVDFTTGRVEARIKVPQGLGYWPAFWMMPTESHYGGWPISGEIDIMEIRGDQITSSHGTIHYGPLWPLNIWNGQTYNLSDGDFNSEFHDFSIEWTEYQIRWFVDGELFHIQTPEDLGFNPWNYNRNYHIILNLAVGGWFSDFPDENTVFPQSMEVEYVRVYQVLDNTMISGRKDVQRNTQNERYYCSSIDGATYTWSVTNGSIVSGHGSPEVFVNWEDDNGVLQCEIQFEECTSTISKEVAVAGTECEFMVNDFEGVRKFWWTGSDGAHNAYSANPFQNGENDSPRCASYVRNNTVQYDGLRHSMNFISDSEILENGDLVFAMDVYTTSEPGAKININLENQQAANGGYPNGRRSVFETETIVAGEWHTIYFEHTLTPDQNTDPGSINQMVMLFEPNSFSNSTWFYDNFRLVDPACIVNSVGENNVDFKVYPNPTNGQINLVFTSQVDKYQVLNNLGQILDESRVQANQMNLTLNLSPGFYSIRVWTQNQFSTQSILVK